MRRFWVVLILLVLGCACIGPSPAQCNDPAPATRLVHINTPNDFLKDDYTDLLIEVTSVDGGVIKKDAFAYLASTVKAYCHKEQVVLHFNDDITTDRPYNLLLQGNAFWFPAWDINATLELEKTAFKLHTTKNLLVLHIAVIGASYTPNFPHVRIGSAYDSHYIALYKEADRYQKAVLVHEFGHVMGLVKSAGNHTDPEHNDHCNDPKCVMYWSVSETEVIDFCGPCWADITLGGGKKHYY